MEIGDVYQLEITKLDHKGRGIGRIHNKIIFVSGALPKEIISAKIVVNKKKYAEAEMLKIIKRSDERVEPKCPYFEKCGGCDLLHLKIESQREFKRQKVKELLDHFTNVNCSCVKPILFSDSIYFYRNKATFKVKEQVGYFEKKSFQIVPIDQCQIVAEEINDILNQMKQLPFLDVITEIIIRTSQKKDTMAILKVNKSIDRHEVKKWLKNYVNTLLLYEKGEYQILWGSGYIIDTIGNFQFKISKDSFFQINSFATKLLYDKVSEYANLKGTEQLVDLYCGTGTIGIYLHKNVKSVLGVEINKNAVMDARENANMNEVSSTQFLCGDVAKLKQKIHADVVIVDPPRAGLDHEVVSFLLQTKPIRIIYVSCDAATLARDLELLSTFYKTMEITPVDMFPNTHHVECVALLCLKETS